jgi:hypothetical protein
MGQPLRLDVAVDEEVATQLLQQGQSRPCERHVQLDLERWRGQHQRTQPRGVIVHPGRRNDRAHTLCDHHDVLHRDAMLAADVGDEAVQVTHQGVKPGGIPALPRGTAVAARIPGKEGGVGQVELVNQMRHPARMLMPAMQQHDRPGRRAWLDGRPMPVEQCGLVKAVELPLLRLTHAISW